MLNLFLTRRFLPLFVTQFLGALSDNVLKNAFVMLITFKVATERGWETTVVVNLITALLIFPMVLFSAFAGQLADRYEKAALIRKTKIGEFILMSIAAWGFAAESVELLFFAVFLAGIQMAFFGPLKYGILPSHLKREELMDGAAIFEAATFVAILMGTILGGWAFVHLPTGETGMATWLAPALVLMGFLAWLTACAIPPAMPTGEKVKIDWNPARCTWQLLGEAKKNPIVWKSLIGISWFWALGAIWLSYIPPFVKEVLHLGNEAASHLLFVFSLGIGVGSMATAWMQKGEIHLRAVPWAGIGISVATFLFLGVQSLSQDLFTQGSFELFSWSGILISFALFCIAAFGGVFSVPLYATMQAMAEPSRRSRTVAANNVLNAIFMVGASLFAMILGSVMGGGNAALFVMAILTLPVSLWFRSRS